MKSGFNINLGDGTNHVSFAGISLITKSLTYAGGAGEDSIQLGTISARMGPVTISLGEGANSVTFSGYELKMGGLLKITAGAGDDTVELGTTDLRLSKGVQFLAGDGVNGFTVAGNAFQSGPIKVEYGEHAAGVSSVLFASTSTTVSGAMSIAAGSGNESVTVAGEVFAGGAVNLNLGDGDHAVITTGFSARLSSLNVTGGLRGRHDQPGRRQVTLRALRLLR